MSKHDKYTHVSPTGQIFTGEKRQTNEEIIQYAIDNNFIDSLSLYYFLQLRFSNSVIYDYSADSLAEKINIKASIVDRLVTNLLDHGYAQVKYQHLILKGRKHLVSRVSANRRKNGMKIPFSKIHKCSLIIDFNSSLEDIKYQLYTKVIEKAIDQQLWAVEHESDYMNMCNLKNPKNLKELKKGREKFNKYALKYKAKASSARIYKCSVTSYRFLAKLLNLSLSKVYSTIKNMITSGYLTIDTLRWTLNSKATHVSTEMYEAIKDIIDTDLGYSYLNDGKIVIVPGSNIKSLFSFKERKDGVDVFKEQIKHECSKLNGFLNMGFFQNNKPKSFHQERQHQAIIVDQHYDWHRKL